MCGKSTALTPEQIEWLVAQLRDELDPAVLAETVERVKAFAPKYAPLPTNPFSLFAIRRAVFGPFKDGTYYAPELGRDVTEAEAEKLNKAYTNNEPTPPSMFVRKSRAQRKAKAQEWKLELKAMVKALYFPYAGA